MDLPPVSILVAYSDGPVERHHEDILRMIVDLACDQARSGTAGSIAEEDLAALVPDPRAAEDHVCPAGRS